MNTAQAKALEFRLQAASSRTAWTALAGVLLFAAMCIPFFLGRVYMADDLGEFHLPMRDFYLRQLAAGEAFDWMPTLFCGFYATGEGQVGGYHPLHLVLYKFLPLGAAFDLELLLSYPFLAIGTYLMMRRIPLRRDAAAFGTLVFTFSGFNLLHFVHPNAIAVVAHIPWLLFAIDVAIRTHNPRTARLAECGIAVLTGSQLLLGYPQYVWFSLLCEAAWSVWRLYRHSHPWRVMPRLIIAMGIGVLIGSVQLLPTIDALQSSTRQSADASFRNDGSLHPLNFVQLIAPYLFSTRVVGQNTHELGLYVGAVPLVLCAWLILRRNTWDSWSKSIWALFAVAAIALLYAMGEHGPIYRVQAYLPFVNSFRFPCRAIVVFQLAVAILSAIALTRLINSRDNDLRPLWVLPVASGLVSIVCMLCFSPYVASPAKILLGPVLIGIALALLIFSARDSRIGWALLLLFAAVDQGTYGLSYAILSNTNDLNQYASKADLPPHPITGRIVAQYTDNGRVGNRSLLAGFARADGYAGLEPAQNLNLQAAGVEWQRTGPKAWQSVPNTLPKVRFNNSPDSQITIDQYRPGKIDLTINHDGVEELIIAESYHPGWQADDNGDVVPMTRTEHGFIGITVPTGQHRIHLQFAPTSLHYGRLLTAFGVSLTGGWFAIALTRPRIVSRN